MLKAHLRRMLGRENDGIDTGGLAVIVILNGDLSFSVGAQIVYQAGLSDLKRYV